METPTFFVILIGCFSVILYLLESKKRTGYFTVAFFLALTGVADLLGPSPLAAATVSFGLLLLIFAISKQKFAYTHFTLLYNDVFGFDWSVFRDIFFIYRKPLIVGAIVISSVSTVAWSILALLPSAELPLAVPLSLALGGGILTRLMLSKALHVQRSWNTDGHHISNFLATMLDQRGMPADFVRLDLRPGKTYPDIAAAPAQVEKAPHIVLVGQESTFPPGLFGLPEEEDVTQFFKEPVERRELNVEIFGGQTIISHMSCLTGLSSYMFGEHRPYAPRYWKDRIKVSLPHFLKAHGYSVHSFLSAEHGWMGIGGFYESLGFDAVFSASCYAPDASRNLLAHRDSVIFDAAMDSIRCRISAGERRTATVLETLRNHSPFTITKTADCREVASKQWFLRNAGHLPDTVRAEAAEWYGRLRASVDDYNRFRSTLAAEFPDEDFVIVHYGDHQPSFTAKLTGAAHPQLFRTYVSVDRTSGPKLTTEFDRRAETIFNIDLIIAKEAGLPLNGFLNAKLNLLRYGSAENFGVGSSEFNGILSSLVAAGLLLPSRS